MTNDPYLALIKQQWPAIAEIYNQFAEQQPIMLLDVQSSEIHAFPFEEFVLVLQLASRRQVETQYRRAVANRQMVLFVRDTENKVFQSYTLALEE
jgi:hypothetical protein